MDTSEIGLWALFLFWGSAIGGIAIAISWARSKTVSRAYREGIVENLKQRLENGEISREDYEEKIRGLPKRASDE